MIYIYGYVGHMREILYFERMCISDISELGCQWLLYEITCMISSEKDNVCRVIDNFFNAA